MSEHLPHVVVACVVEREGKFLLVEEAIAGASVLNQPAGHWEIGESLIDAAVRETLEESGWDVRIDHLLGLYSHHPAGLPYPFLRVAFAATALHHHADAILDDGILRALWLPRDAIADCRERHRSPMVLQCIDDYCAGVRLPLTALHHLE